MKVTNYLNIAYLKQKRNFLNRAIAMGLSVVMVMGIPITSNANELEPDISFEDLGFERTTFSLSEQARSINFNKDWKFALDITENASDSKFDDSSWRKLDLPHDWSIEKDFTNEVSSEIGHLPGGVGWYRKNFVLPKELDGKRINIDFDGVYMDSYIYVNGKPVGNYPNGYLPFSFDITDYVTCDGETENVIAVKVTNVTKSGQQSSRWYSGSGIYRDVFLTVTDTIHVGQYGTAIYTPKIAEEYSTGNVTVDITTTVENETNKPVEVVVRNTILDYKTGEPAYDSVSSEPQQIEANNKADIKQNIIANNPKLWSVETPNLYNMKTEILVNDQIRDTYITRFGFTWSNFDKDNGFSLNGKEMKLYGVCMHHDQGALGAIDNPTAIERQMRIMKDMGVNSIRVTHNPASPDLMRICDEMGLMVVEEAFDTWYAGKNRNDYGRFFEAKCTYPGVSSDTTWAKFDLQQMIRSNRNCPSIIMWSLGNEIGETNSQKGLNTVKNLVKWAKEIDTQHPVTMGEDKFRIHSNATMDDWFVKVANELDVVGMNYAESNYDHFRTILPNKPLYGSETSSAIKSRGYYSDPKKDGSNDAQQAQDVVNYQLSSYDNRAVPWGKTATNSWIPDRDRKWIAGEYIWTGFDYIGEPTPWNQSFVAPSKNSYFGIVDTAGFPKSDYYLYQSQWLDVNENPMVYIFPHWNWENEELRNKVIDSSGNIPIRIYSNAPKVELFVDDISKGEKAFAQKQTNYDRPYQQESEDSNRLYLEWELPWEYVEGRTIKAVAKDNSGKIIAEDIVVTAGAPAKLSAKVEREIINADGTDLAYIEVSVLDKNGNIIPTAMNQMNFRISGEGKIVGVDNGDPASWERYKDTDGIWKRSAFNGKALVIVQSTEKSGSFTLTAQSAGLESSSLTVYTKQQNLPEDTILGYEVQNILTDVGQVPTLPKTVKAVYADGRKEDINVTWDKLNEEQFKEPAEIYLTGETQTGAKVSITIIVRGPYGVRPISVVTLMGTIPELPNSVTIIWSDGKTETKNVKKWDEITQDQVSKPGTFKVFGELQDSEYKAIANVRVVEELEDKNIALSSMGTTVEVTYEEGVHKKEQLIDGNLSSENGWGNWNKSSRKEDTATLTFDKEYDINKVNIWINQRKSWQVPNEIIIKYWNGNKFVPVENQSKTKDFVGWIDSNTDYNGNEITFNKVKTNKLSFTFKVDNYSSGKDMLKITEIQVFSPLVLADKEAKLEDLKVDDVTVEGFSPDVTDYFYPTDYESDVPVISATPKGNANIFIRQPLTNNSIGSVEVTSEDGKTTTNYNIQFGRKDAVLKTVKLTLPEEVTQDDIVDIEVEGTLQDGTKVSKDEAIVKYYVENGTGKAEIKNGQLLAYKPGDVTVYITMNYMGTEVESEHIKVNILKNEDEKYITSFEPVKVKTSSGKEPTLPDTVIANYNTGLPQELKVKWNKIDSKLYEGLNSFNVQGKVSEKTDIKPVAEVDVIEAIAVDNFSLGVAEGYEPELPEETTIYLSDGTEEKGKIEWENIETFEIGDIKTYNGKVNYLNQELPIKLTARVGNSNRSENFVIQRNGYDLPIGIASYTNSDPSDTVKNLNDGQKYDSADGKKIWCSWNSPNNEDWISVTIAKEGLPVERTVNEIEFGLLNENNKNGIALPENYYVEYYTGPLDYEMDLSNNDNENIDKLGSDHPLNDSSNWKEVKYINKAEIPNNTNFRNNMKVEFEPVKTHLIRVRMEAQSDKCLGVDELEVYGQVSLVSDDFEVEEISFDGKNLIDDFDNNNLTFELNKGDKLPEVQVKATENASVTIIPASVQNKKMTIKIVPESGAETNIQVYTVEFVGGDALEPIKSYNITFESNGGSEIESYTVAEGNKVEEPKKPIKDGYKFVGWYTDEDFKNEFNFGEPVKEDVTLYAKWSKKDSGGNSGSSNSSDNSNQKPAEIVQKPKYEDKVIDSNLPILGDGNKYRVSLDNDKKVNVLSEKIGDTIKLKFEQDGKNIENIGQYINVSIPSNSNDTGIVAVIVNESGTEEIIKKSFLKDSNVIVPVNKACTLRLDNRSVIFDDVQENQWFNNAVKFVTSRELFAGTTNTEFSPNLNMTRGMLATVLYRLENEPNIDNNISMFKDVPSTSYYNNAINWAAQNNYVAGISEGIFAPDDVITREQLATILYRYCGENKYSNNTLNPDIKFKDMNEVSDWAKDAIIWATDKKILSGRPDGTIEPKGNATRAEVATVLMYMITNL